MEERADYGDGVYLVPAAGHQPRTDGAAFAAFQHHGGIRSDTPERSFFKKIEIFEKYLLTNPSNACIVATVPRLTRSKRKQMNRTKNDRQSEYLVN